jgi:hypothetical protein
LFLPAEPDLSDETPGLGVDEICAVEQKLRPRQPLGLFCADEPDGWKQVAVRDFNSESRDSVNGRGVAADEQIPGVSYVQRGKQISEVWVDRLWNSSAKVRR